MITIALLAAALSADPQPLRIEWIAVEATWCLPCVAADVDMALLRPRGWRVGPKPGAHIRQVDYDLSPDFVASMKIESVPTFILMRDGKEVERHVGYPGRAYLARRYVVESRKK